MSIKPVLGDWEVPRIQKLTADEQRRFAELPIPGKAGSLLQDLNRAPSLVEIQGSVFSAEEREGFLESVREKFNAGEALTFVSDITHATDIQYVVIEQLLVEENASYPDEISYYLKLKESPPPPPPADPFGALDTSLLDMAGDFIDSVTGILDAIDALANIPDFSDPSAMLGGTLNDVTGAVSGLSDVGGLIDDLFGGN